MKMAMFLPIPLKNSYTSSIIIALPTYSTSLFHSRLSRIKIIHWGRPRNLEALSCTILQLVVLVRLLILGASRRIIPQSNKIKQ